MPSPPPRSSALPASSSVDDARAPAPVRRGGRGLAGRRCPAHARAVGRCAAAGPCSRDRSSHRLPPRPGGDALRAGQDGYPLIVGAAAQIADDDPELAVVMLAQAVHGCFYTGDTRAMIAAAERAVALAKQQDSRRATFFAAMASGMALVSDGQGEAGAAAARQAVRILEESDELRDDPGLLVWAAIGPLWLREAEHWARPDRASIPARARAGCPRIPAVSAAPARARPSYDRSMDGCRIELRRSDTAGAGDRSAASKSRRRWPGSPGWRHDRGARRVAVNMPPKQRRCARSSVSACSASGQSRRSAISSSVSAGRPRRSGITRPRRMPCAGRYRRRRPLAGAGARRGVLRLGREDEAAAGRCRFRGTRNRQGPAVGARPRRPLPRAAGGRRRAGTLLRGSAGAPSADTRRVRDRPHPPGVRRGAAACPQTRRARVQLRAAVEIFERLGAQSWIRQADAELEATGLTHDTVT